MQITALQKHITDNNNYTNIFKQSKTSLALMDIHGIRYDVIEFLQLKNVTKPDISKIILALTEILSNLVKHPAKKLQYLEVILIINSNEVEMEIKDDSAPFAKFNAKCEKASLMLNTPSSNAESGYGLGIVISICGNPIYTPIDKSSDNLNHFITKHKLKENINEVIILKKKTIFLVDDEPIALSMHKSMLEDKYNVLCFETAESALIAFTEHQPDMIISDLIMPEMTGIELQEALANIENGNTTPFIFLSGNTKEEHNIYMRDSGVDDFLYKPITQERLDPVITKLLKRSHKIYSSLQDQLPQDINKLPKPYLPVKSQKWNITANYQAAEAGGGDFIIYHETSESLTVVLADVMGHSTQAKFFSYIYEGYLCSIFQTQKKNSVPSEFLQQLSKSIDVDPFLESVILTCQCFQLFPDGTIKIASAGHPLPILIKKKQSKLITVMGPLPGLIGDNRYKMKTIKLDPNDKILFMTDGFLDVFNPTGDAAKELLTTINCTREKTSEELSNCLWEEFFKKQTSSSVRKDDATIIVTEYKG